ncbi:hypothetical protein ACFQX8_28705 [Klenkia terrae]|uniref:hypothetical protein n=1 Tax=Klenkia terrae TaxID=1052259 RepID=UPI003609E574
MLGEGLRPADGDRDVAAQVGRGGVADPTATSDRGRRPGTGRLVIPPGAPPLPVSASAPATHPGSRSAPASQSGSAPRAPTGTERTSSSVSSGRLVASLTRGCGAVDPPGSTAAPVAGVLPAAGAV